jgi:2,3-dihydroxybenzoate decarboxylase
MKGKIALEEHFAVEDTLSDSLPFVPPEYQAELKHRLFDFYDKRLGLMDKHGIEPILWTPTEILRD